MSLADAVTNPPERYTRRSIIDGLLDTLPGAESNALREMLTETNSSARRPDQPWVWVAEAVTEALASECGALVSASAVREWRRKNVEL